MKQDQATSKPEITVTGKEVFRNGHILLQD